jgi:hypothetical protein
MEKIINLNKEVFDKKTYQKTINTSFSQLGVPPIQSQLDDQPTVQEFFNMYNDLFYQINELGPDNSHEYLVKTSGEYIAFEEKDELIEALQKEIGDLRKELLQAEQDLADSLGDLAEASQPLPEIEEIEEELPSPVLDIVNTPPVEDPAPPTPEPKTASPQDTAQFAKGYKYQIITLNALINNMEFFINEFPGLLPKDPGNELRDLRQIGSKDNVTEATYNDYFYDYIKVRSSGNETKNINAVLAVTTDFIRDNFQKNKEFGTGFMTLSPSNGATDESSFGNDRIVKTKYQPIYA